MSDLFLIHSMILSASHHDFIRQKTCDGSWKRGPRSLKLHGGLLIEKPSPIVLIRFWADDASRFSNHFSNRWASQFYPGRPTQVSKRMSHRTPLVFGEIRLHGKAMGGQPKAKVTKTSAITPKKCQCQALCVSESDFGLQRFFPTHVETVKMDTKANTLRTTWIGPIQGGWEMLKMTKTVGLMRFTNIVQYISRIIGITGPQIAQNHAKNHCG